MPTAPLRPCPDPHCGRLTSGGPCPQHAKPQDQATGWGTAGAERIRGRRLQQLRARLFKDEPLCRLCRAAGRLTVATIRDHIVPLAEAKGDPDDESNIQPLCGDCHRAKSEEEARCGQGGPAPRYVITGPPNSGKSTWCRSHAKDDDIVWDWDMLASALTLQGRHRPRQVDGTRGRWPSHTAGAMLAMREALVTWLSQRQTPRASVYVIIRDKVEARAVAERIGAELVEWSRARWRER